jgi:hypothetical protein
MRRMPVLVPLLPLALASLAVLAGCSAGTAGGPTTASSASHVASPAATPTPAGSPSQAAASADVDPCALVTSAEASALTGASMGAGTESDTDGGKRCVYGAGTASGFFVQFAQASDAATAQADWAQEQASAQSLVQQQLPSGVSADFTTNALSGLGDKAAAGSASIDADGHTIAISSIYLLKGSDFLAFGGSGLDTPAATTTALEQQARTSLARLP